MTAKRLNPYCRLLKDIRKFVNDLRFRHTKSMWRYPMNKLNNTWSLKDLYERTKAAEQLGYKVELIADDDGLNVMYVKEIPDIPYDWKHW